MPTAKNPLEESKRDDGKRDGTIVEVPEDEESNADGLK